MENVRTKEQKAFEALKEQSGYSNPLESPRLEKVIVSSGIGSMQDQGKREIVRERLTLITGQKPSPRGARQSIASFKLRQGDVVGYQVTLRGQRMYDFLDKLLNIALPRTKDFKGLSRRSLDEMGNYTIGVSEHTIFPETPDEELRNIFGLAITVVTTARNKKEAEGFLEHIGFPFKEE